MKYVKTVCGDIPENDLGVTLVHEHICCYSEYLYAMAGNRYLDKAALADRAVAYLMKMKEEYQLATIVDCTPINIGRDPELLKDISKRTGINLLCATGFYYTEEPLVNSLSVETLADYVTEDAERVNAGIIKCAVERKQISQYDEKVLRACAKAQLSLGLPLVLHTNANHQNGLRAMEILLSEGVKPQAITVGHLSDTEDLEYVKKIAGYGCYVGLDRLYENKSREYISKKLESINALCEAGFTQKILLSHDALFFNGFESNPKLNPAPRLAYCFSHILSELDREIADDIMIRNPQRMLRAE